MYIYILCCIDVYCGFILTKCSWIQVQKEDLTLTTITQTFETETSECLRSSDGQDFIHRLDMT